MNLASGVRLEKMNLTPVDHLSDVKAEIQLTWKKWHERADTRPGELSRRVCRDERRIRRDPGSFLGVVVDRVPGMVLEEESRSNLLFPASHCPVCQHALRAWENIPLLSWLALRGRCRCCKSPIPLRLFLLELLTAVFFGLTAQWIPDLASLFSLWVLAAFLLPLAMIDGQHQLLPDCLTQPLLWAGLLFHAFSHGLPLRDALLGAVAGYLSLWLVYWAFRLLTRREGLGYGDFKLLAALGAGAAGSHCLRLN